MVAHERLTEPRVIMERLLAKPRSFSNLLHRKASTNHWILIYNHTNLNLRLIRKIKTAKPSYQSPGLFYLKYHFARNVTIRINCIKSCIFLNVDFIRRILDIITLYSIKRPVSSICWITLPILLPKLTKPDQNFMSAFDKKF